MTTSTNIHNHTQARLTNQVNFKNNSRTLYFIDSAMDYFALTKNLTQKGPSKVMDYILWLGYFNASLSASVSQLNIAKACGLSIRQVRRIVEDLIAQGFLSSKDTVVILTNGEYRKITTYNINILFSDKLIRIRLQYLLRNLCEDTLKRKMDSYKAKVEYKESRSKQEYIDECFNLLTSNTPLKKVLSKNSLAFQETLYSNEKKCPVDLERNIYTHTHEEFVCDDGAVVSQESRQAVADILFGSETVTVFKKNNQKQNNKTVLSLSLNSFLKNNSSQYQQQVSSMKNETLYTKTILPVTDQLKSIRPTIWGQIKLMGYTEEAILYADSVLLACKKNIKNPWTYFIGICKKYSEENNLEVKWSLVITLSKQYSMPNEGPFIDESFVPTHPVHVSSRKTYNNYSQSNQTKPRELSFDEMMKSQWKDERVDLDREKELRGAQLELSSLASTNPFAAILMRGINELSQEKTTNEPLIQVESDKNTGENIMSKNPDSTHITSYLKSLIASPMPINKLTDKYAQPVTKPHDLIEDDLGYDEAYDLLGVNDPFGDRE